MASALSALFGGAVRVRNRLYDSGVLRAERLRGPVVSVGNLSVGGAGKTPFVILLGGLLHARGIEFDVLSRGYRRQSTGVKLVDPAGEAREFGDEPLLIARRLGVPVIVGEERHRAGLYAEERFGPRLHLLDDGFQHRQLARDFDIVLVTPDDARDRLVPAGRLRETLPALRRADAVVLASGAGAAAFPLEGKRVWRVRRSLEANGVPPQPIAFCAIARPQNFFAQLRKAGVAPAAETAFPDHYAYTERDVRDLEFVRGQIGAGGFVTTEKDEVNLGRMAARLEPLAVARVRMSLADAEAAVESMLETLRARGKGV
jgi:tetraacyldisaccharide 4'-kinase